MTRNKLLTILTLSLLSLARLAYAANAAPPDQVVEQTAKAIFDTVNKDKAELQKDPNKLYDVVGNTLLPHFDFALASQLVLGPYWRSANDAQKKSFQDAFYSYLIRSYADALVRGNYSERNIQVQPRSEEHTSELQS